MCIRDSLWISDGEKRTKMISDLTSQAQNVTLGWRVHANFSCLLIYMFIYIYSCNLIFKIVYSKVSSICRIWCFNSKDQFQMSYKKHVRKLSCFHPVTSTWYLSHDTAIYLIIELILSKSIITVISFNIHNDFYISNWINIPCTEFELYWLFYSNIHVNCKLCRC